LVMLTPIALMFSGAIVALVAVSEAASADKGAVAVTLAAALLAPVPTA
jgi:NADH:ubiquinone oxidoreductase subunit K